MTLTLFCAFQPALIFWCTVSPLLSGTQEIFTLFVQRQDTSCLTEITSLPKPPKDINENAGATYCFFWRLCGNIYLHFYRNNVNAKCLFDNWCWQLSRCLEGELWEVWQGIKKAVQQPLLHCTIGMILRSQEKPGSHLYK